MDVAAPGLEGVIADETTISLVDGESGRLLYRGYRIEELVGRGTYEQTVALLLEGSWPAGTPPLPDPAPLPAAVDATLRSLPGGASPLDALRTAVSVWGIVEEISYPPHPNQAWRLLTFAPAALGAFARLRGGEEPVDQEGAGGLGVAGRYLYFVSGERPDPAAERALDAYFTVGAEHGFNASTFALRVIISTRSDLASGVVGAIGALKGPLHGGAPSEVEAQLAEMGSAEQAEQWMREALARGERLMGFGHRVYRARDPRADALRKVAEELAGDDEWLLLAMEVEPIALRLLEERHPDRQLPTNVEYYASAVLRGTGLTPDLYTPAFAVARMAGWCAHALEQAEKGRLIRPRARYVGPTPEDRR
ncbi:MAG: citrate synthase [Acidimicrobiia bacterium]